MMPKVIERPGRKGDREEGFRGKDFQKSGQWNSRIPTRPLAKDKGRKGRLKNAKTSTVQERRKEIQLTSSGAGEKLI